MTVDPYLLILDRWLFSRYAMDYYEDYNDDPHNAEKCEEILNLVRENKHRVAIDEEYMIPTTEWNEFRDIPLIREWIKYILNGKVERLSRSDLQEPIDDGDDQHYAEIALSSPASIMISGDQPLKKDINSRKDIDLGIWDQSEGVGLLHWHQNQA